MNTQAMNDQESELRRLRWLAKALRWLERDMEAAAIEFQLHILERTPAPQRASSHAMGEANATT